MYAATHTLHTALTVGQYVIAPVAAAFLAWLWGKLRAFGRLLDSVDKSVNNKDDGEPTLREVAVEIKAEQQRQATEQQRQAVEQRRQGLAQEQMQADLAANTAATVRVDHKVDEHIAFHKGAEAAKRR